MPEDVVLDANILAHGEDKRHPDRAIIRQFLGRLIRGRSVLCVDEGFHPHDRTRIRSLIGNEYLTCALPGSIGFALILAAHAGGRIRKYGRNIDRAARRVIEVNVRDRRDRVYAKVAFQCNSRILVSHDTRAFTGRCCTVLRRQLRVSVMNAVTANGLPWA